MIEVINTYYDTEYINHFVVVELKVDGKELKKKVLIEDALECLMHKTYPPVTNISDNKLFKKCQELAIQRVKVV